MAKQKKQWFKPPSITNINTGKSVSIGNGIKNTGNIVRTTGISLTPIITGSASSTKRNSPGFTPNEVYVADNTSIAPYGWYGNLLDSHFDSKNYDPTKGRDFDTDFKERKSTFQRFDDWRTDYFLHDLQQQGFTTNPTATDQRSAFSGNIDDLRLNNLKSTWEHQDPVIYSFEIIIDAISSPLLNGSITDFFKIVPNMGEIQSKVQVYEDFKRQFTKLFKTKGTIKFDDFKTPLMSDLGSDDLSNFALSNTNSPIHSRGRKPYLAHYLQKIDGLNKLVEANGPDTKKYLVDYNKDVIKLTFLEDVSGTMAALAHLYKLLYWSKPNGKSLIPENLLRFNCDIVVCEVRNFNRVRKSMDGSSIEVLRDNVSRHVYSLKECQFYFDKMPHEDGIDLGQTKVFETFEVNFDYKYSSLRFEKWVSDVNNFGKYVGYNGGTIWKSSKGANKPANGTTPPQTNISVPSFYTQNTNSLAQPGVTQIDVIKSYTFKAQDTPKKDQKSAQAAGVDTTISDNVGKSSQSEVSEDAQGTTKEAETKTPSSLDKFKAASKKAIVNAGKKVANAAIADVNNQLMVRAQLLTDTINKIRNALGINGLQTDPTNVYPKPYSPLSFGIFFDVRNELWNFAGEGMATTLAGFGNIANPFKNPMNPNSNPLGAIVQKYSTLPTTIKNNSNMVGNTLNDIVKKFGGKK